MIVKERLNPEIWEFWIRTHKAWLSGALSSFDPLPQEIAKNTLVIERFADDSPKVTAAIRKLIPRPDEFLVSYSPDDCDVLLTNQRLMVRTHQDVRYEIIELSEIVTYTETGFFNKTVNLSLHNGLVRRFTKLKGAIKEECMRFALTNCPKKEVLQAPEPVSISRTKNLRTSPLSPVLREWYFEKTIQQGVESMSEKDGDMIGSEYQIGRAHV